jgi:hypothetical protein
MNPATKLWIYNILLNDSRKKYPNFPDEARAITIYPDTNEKGIKKNMKQICTALGLLWQNTDSKAKPLHKMERVDHASGLQRTNHSFTFVKSEFAKGHHDCQIIAANRVWCIEIKARNETTKYKDKQSEVQKEFERKLNRNGTDYYIVRGMDDFMELVKDVLKVIHGEKLF